MAEIPKCTSVCALLNIAEEFPTVFSTDGKGLFCKICAKHISALQRSEAVMHLDSQMHKIGLQIAPSKSRLTEPAHVAASVRLCCQAAREAEVAAFNRKLAEVVVYADIPLRKFQHPEMRKWLKKYTSHDVPGELPEVEEFREKRNAERLESKSKKKTKMTKSKK